MSWRSDEPGPLPATTSARCLNGKRQTSLACSARFRPLCAPGSDTPTATRRSAKTSKRREVTRHGEARNLALSLVHGLPGGRHRGRLHPYRRGRKHRRPPKAGVERPRRPDPVRPARLGVTHGRRRAGTKAPRRPAARHRRWTLACAIAVADMHDRSFRLPRTIPGVSIKKNARPGAADAGLDRGYERGCARKLLGLRGVEPHDARVRVRRAEHVAVSETAEGQIVHVLRLAAEEAGGLEALGLTADEAGGGRHGPYLTARALTLKDDAPYSAEHRCPAPTPPSPPSAPPRWRRPGTGHAGRATRTLA